MKQLLVYCHPNPGSFCHGILETMISELKLLGQDLRIRDLYALHLDPVLRSSDFEAFEKGQVPRDIQIEQDHIRWAENLIFIYPLWWTGLPALLKGYIDRVFSLGFAYAYDTNGPRGLLGGKNVYMVTTMGASVSLYEQLGLLKSMDQTIDQGIGGFCAMTLRGHKYLGNVPNATEEERSGMLEEIKQIARQLSAVN
jgi:NAD(P)H dehydrogenase (quinone)